jgi:hypothetical protein
MDRWNKLMNCASSGVPIDEAIESEEERPYYEKIQESLANARAIGCGLQTANEFV